jgi:hypothetical protein
VAGRDQARMRNLGVLQRRQDHGLAADRLVRIGALMNGRPPQDEVVLAAPEAEQQVLGAAREAGEILDRTAAESLPVHPAGQGFRVDSLHLHPPYLCG